MWGDNYYHPFVTEEEAGALGGDGWPVGGGRAGPDCPSTTKSSFQFSELAWSQGVDNGGRAAVGVLGGFGQNSAIPSRLPWALPTADHMSPSGVARAQVLLASLLCQHAHPSQCNPSPQPPSSEKARKLRSRDGIPRPWPGSHRPWVWVFSLFGATWETWVGVGASTELENVRRSAFFLEGVIT